MYLMCLYTFFDKEVIPEYVHMRTAGSESFWEVLLIILFVLFLKFVI